MSETTLEVEESTDATDERSTEPGKGSELDTPGDSRTHLRPEEASSKGRRGVDNPVAKLAQIESAPGKKATLRKARSSLHLWLIIGGLALASIIAAAIFLSRRTKPAAKEQTSSDSPGSPSVITLAADQRAAIAVEVVQQHTLRGDVTTPGKVAFNGNKVTPVFSQFSGRIMRLEAEVGSTMHAGQVLGVIDTPDIVGMQSDYLQALTAERSAQTTLELAKRTRERTERLAAAEAVPQRDLQQAKADESRAADDLQRAHSTVAAAQGRLQSAGMSEAEISRLASGARAVNRLVPLVAPIAGTITERKAGVGQVVQPGAGDPLFMIADLSSVWVTADVYEDQLAYIRAGATVKIKTPAYRDETFAARVDQIASALDPDKHTLAVRCVVANPGRRLKPGMFASVILSSGAQTVITVPSSAVVAEGDERSVFVEESSGQYLKRLVETGNEINGSLIIRSGLKEGDRVVVRGGLLISAGPGS